eukprot:13611906-Alexandrium_andersonii.AAC.1
MEAMAAAAAAACHPAVARFLPRGASRQRRGRESAAGGVCCCRFCGPRLPWISLACSRARTAEAEATATRPPL